MGQNCDGWEWFMNGLKNMEDRCLEMCDALEKDVLKYVEGESDPVGVEEERSQEERLDVREDQSPDKGLHDSSPADAFAEVPGEHHVQTERQTIRSSDKQSHCIIEPNHLSVYQEISGARKIKNENAKAKIPTSRRKKNQKVNVLAEERAKFTLSTMKDDEFPDWEII